MPDKKTAKKTAKDQAAELVLTDLEQVRVLSDPLRLRIVEQLCQEESTTKQVAEALGEKPTKLYHHVEALEKVGLIRQTRTRRNRGTLERYYLAVARKFKADATLFGEPEAAADTEAIHSVVSTIVETTGRELKALADRGGKLMDGPTREGVISFLHIEADQKTIDRVQRRLMRLIEDLQKVDDPDADDEPQRQFRLTLAFYPLDVDDQEPS